MKLKDAKVGQKVKYNGWLGELSSTISFLMPKFPDDPSWIEGWAVVEVDQKPEHWPYLGDDFAPLLNNLEVV